MPPTIWLMTVADAAPTMPPRSTPTSRKSSTMLVRPASTVKARPSFGFSEVMKKLWKKNCIIKAVWNTSRMRPYIRQFGSSSGVAPSNWAAGSSRNQPMMVETMPITIVEAASIENRLSACFLSPVPSVMATSALPPVPTMKPRQPNACRNG